MFEYSGSFLRLCGHSLHLAATGVTDPRVWPSRRFDFSVRQPLCPSADSDRDGSQVVLMAAGVGPLSPIRYRGAVVCLEPLPVRTKVRVGSSILLQGACSIRLEGPTLFIFVSPTWSAGLVGRSNYYFWCLRQRHNNYYAHHVELSSAERRDRALHNPPLPPRASTTIVIRVAPFVI